MSLENSPSLKDFAQGMPPPPPDPARGRRRAQITILGLSLVLVVLLVMNLLQSPLLSSLAGSGTITGLVLDASGKPLAAEIIIERTEIITRSDAGGRFAVQQVPAGEHLLVVARDGVGVEYPIVAIAGTTVDIGTVQAETTAVPLP